jgi:hypothetical protein
MKTCALYGFISSLAGAFLILALYFLGFHSDQAKLGAAKWIGGIGGLAIGVTCTALGVKARRDEVPASEEFGYGSALWAGVVISFVASVLSALFTYAYHAFINTGFSEILIQDAMSKLEAKGISGPALDKMEAFNRFMFTPVWEAVIALVFGFIFGVLLSLIIAAFVKRPAPPKVAAA